MEGAAAQLSSSSAEGTQCSMTISRLSQSDHGEWTCKLSLGSIQDDQETQVTVEVATPATVEFADKYGVVQVQEGTQKNSGSEKFGTMIVMIENDSSLKVLMCPTLALPNMAGQAECLSGWL